MAEKARVPLYLVGAGVLGTNPETVEASLDHALELCRLWNAMLLIDEADVFLGARLDDSLTRNELVSSRWSKNSPPFFLSPSMPANGPRSLL